MKKTFLTLVAAGAMVFTTQTATAQVAGEEVLTTQETQQQQNQDFEQIEVQDLPAEVQQAVERDFQGSTVAEAYVKEKDGERKYKLVVSTDNGESKELYADAQGNWIDKDKKDQQEENQEK